MNLYCMMETQSKAKYMRLNPLIRTQSLYEFRTLHWTSAEKPERLLHSAIVTSIMVTNYTTCCQGIRMAAMTTVPRNRSLSRG